jgi:copper homeostasis protein
MKLLEVIVTSKEEAESAEAGGADRLELIRDFHVGGLTPDFSVVEEVLASVKIPVRVMVRENSSFGVLDGVELDTVVEKSSRLCQLPIDGLVMGYILNGKIDSEVMTKILEQIPPTRVTFHRAFEVLGDYEAAFDALKQFPQIDLILTNGGSGTWSERIERLELLQPLSEPIKFMVGGGVDQRALALINRSSLQNIHVGSVVRSPANTDGVVAASKVMLLRRFIDAET